MVELERCLLKGLELTQLTTHERGPFSLRIEAGECISLRGASGSGKSLLLRAIADLDVHTGKVQLDDIACDTIPAPQWRQQVALIPAESQWWFDEVGAHFTGQCASRNDCLEALGFSAETLSWQVSRLSSGEKQRLALARVLENKPRVLLLDEPTASLDATNTSIVEGLVAEYRQQTQAAVLWVSHDPAQAARVATRHFQLTANGLSEDPGEEQA